MNITNEHFNIEFPKTLESYVKESLSYTENKWDYLCNLFGVEGKEMGCRYVDYFTSRRAFLKYLKQFSNDKIEPWVSGTFYGGGIQLLINLKNKEGIDVLKTALTHETVHLFFGKMFKKYKRERIVWLDESFACSLQLEECDKGYYDYAYMAQLVKDSAGLDMAIFNNLQEVNKNANAYVIFRLIGQYIKENNLYQTYVNYVKSNPKKINQIGKHILADAVDYFLSKVESV